MSEIFIEVEDDNAAVRCDNCTWRGVASDLDMVADVQERISAGYEVPAGQCPDCAALAYLVERPQHSPFKAEAIPAAPSWESVAEVHRDAMRVDMTTDDGTHNEALARAADAVASAIKAYASLLSPGAVAPSVAPSPAALEVLRGIRADNPEFEAGGMVDHADVTARLGRRWGDICRVLDSSPVAPRLHVAVILEGGLCQTVVSDNPALIGLAYDVIDYDTEGADETGEVLQEGGAFADACISGGIIEPASIRVVTDEDYENAAIAAGWQHGGDFDGFWYDAKRFESWKAAASADEDCPTYATVREVCDAEGIHPFPEVGAGQDHRSNSEGWGLFSNGETGGKLEIQADSESSIFVRNGMHYDDEAEAFVKARVAEGSAYHIAALARVGQPG